MHGWQARGLCSIGRLRSRAHRGRNRCRHRSLSVPEGVLAEAQRERAWRELLTVDVMSEEQLSQTNLTPPSVPRTAVFFLIMPMSAVLHQSCRLPGNKVKVLRVRRMSACGEAGHRVLPQCFSGVFRVCLPLLRANAVLMCLRVVTMLFRMTFTSLGRPFAFRRSNATTAPVCILEHQSIFIFYTVRSLSI